MPPQQASLALIDGSAKLVEPSHCCGFSFASAHAPVHRTDGPQPINPGRLHDSMLRSHRLFQLRHCKVSSNSVACSNLSWSFCPFAICPSVVLCSVRVRGKSSLRMFLLGLRSRVTKRSCCQPETLSMRVYLFSSCSRSAVHDAANALVSACSPPRFWHPVPTGPVAALLS